MGPAIIQQPGKSAEAEKQKDAHSRRGYGAKQHGPRRRVLDKSDFR